MTRDNHIAVYVTDETKAELKQRADDTDQSLSETAYQLIQRQLQQDAQEHLTSEARAEERLEELVAIAKDELLGIGAEVADLQQEIQDVNAKAGTYAAANFELLKRDHKELRRQEALATGSRRMQQDLSAVYSDLSEAAEAEESSAPSGNSLVEELRGDRTGDQ